MTTDYDFKRVTKIRVRNFPFYVMPRYRERYETNAYENFTVDLFLHSIHVGDTVMDIGSHYGYYSILAGKALKGSGKVSAFEPVEENFFLLNKNIRANRLTNVTPYQQAVSDSIGEKELIISEASDSCGFYQHPLSREWEKRKVKTISVDSFTKSNQIDILKIDAEGHELPILSGAKKTIQRSPNLKLFIEFNPACLKSAGYAPVDLLHCISAMDYEIYILDDVERRWFRLSQVENWSTLVGDKLYANLYCTPKTKSLSVSFVAHDANLAGAERVLEDLLASLQGKGVLCHVVFPHSGPLEHRLRERGMNIDIVPFSWWAFTQTPKAHDLYNAFKQNYIQTQAITSLVRKYNSHMIFTNTMVIPWGAFAAATLALPHIWLIHEFGDLDHKLIFSPQYAYALKIIDLFSNSIIVNSRAVEKHISKYINPVKIKRISYFITIPQTLLKSRKKFYRQTTALKLLVLGTITSSKGIEDALGAAGQLIKKKYRIELLIAGPTANPSFLGKIKKYIAAHNLSKNVRILGFQSNPYLLINQADILLVCSHAEAFGRVTLEAMLLKKPVIGTRSGGTVELVTNGATGYLYKGGDSRDLAAKIALFYKQRRKIEIYGQAGYRFAYKNFTEEKFSGIIYQELMDLKQTANPLSAYQGLLWPLHTLAKDVQTSGVYVSGIEQQLKEREETLDKIYKSKSWRIITLLRKVRKVFSLNQ